MVDLVHVFIDESGDAGFQCDKNASKYYVVGAAFFPRSNWERCLNDLTRVLLKEYGVRPSNKKISNPSPKIHKQYLKQFVTHEGIFGCVYVEKEQIRDHVSNIITRTKNEDMSANPSVYDKMVKQLLTHLIDRAGVASHMHAHIHNMALLAPDRTARIKYLKTEIDSLLHPFGLKISHRKSESAMGIQCVHLICNGLFKKFEKEDNRFYDVIKRSIIVEEHYEKE